MAVDPVPNAIVDVVVVLDEAGDAPAHIDVSAYSSERGYIQSRLSRGDGPGFAAAWRFLNRPDDRDLGGLRLAEGERDALWRCGLIVAAEEHKPAFLAAAPAGAGGEFDRAGYALLPECLTPAATASIAAYYRDRIAADAFQRGDRQSDRFGARNDPAARVAQRLLERRVERIVGRPIQSSYTYASLYCGGAALPKHRDRLQSEYSLSLLIDCDPVSASGGAPAPLELYVDGDGPPIECDPPVGGGVLFRARQIPHARRALPADGRCWVIVLNYVDAEFDSSLD